MSNILDRFNLQGKTALVTGVSRGLGQAMAIALAEAGADIIGVGMSDSSDTERAIRDLARGYLSIKADLREHQHAQEIVDKAIGEFGKIDILVNNAGTIRRNDLVDFTEQDWDEVMNLNLKSLFFLSQAVAKHYLDRGQGGKIINVASMLSYQGGIRVPSYTSSKSAVKGLTMSLANELAGKGINVNAIAPGYMSTDNTEQLRNDPVRNKEILSRIPAGRWGMSSDMAGAVVFLASEASGYVNGATLAIDGGWLGR